MAGFGVTLYGRIWVTTEEHRRKLNLREALRPQSLDEMIGIESIKSAIQKSIDQECQRWLFEGKTGTGKTTLAWIVARELQGSDSPDTRDVLEINGADLRGISDMRELTDKLAQTCPWNGKYRVIILDEAQQLTEDAKSLLLKPLEQEQSNCVWILCTMDVGKLHRALRDRCTSFRLKDMGKSERHALVDRAVAYFKRTGFEYTGDTDRFLRIIDAQELFSARDVLKAFEQFANGMTAEEAVGL